MKRNDYLEAPLEGASFSVYRDAWEGLRGVRMGGEVESGEVTAVTARDGRPGKTVTAETRLG